MQHCFWKYPEDINNCIKTQSQKEKEKIICHESMMNYFEKKKKKNEKLVITGCSCKFLLVLIKNC